MLAKLTKEQRAKAEKEADDWRNGPPVRMSLALDRARSRALKGARSEFSSRHSMKINGNEIRPGNVIEHKGGLWVAVKTQAVKPGKGPAYAQVELKNAIDGTKLNERFRSSETVERVRLEQKDYQFLFAEGDMLTFMDVDTYDQIQIPTRLPRGARRLPPGRHDGDGREP